MLGSMVAKRRSNSSPKANKMHQSGNTLHLMKRMADDTARLPFTSQRVPTRDAIVQKSRMFAYYETLRRIFLSKFLIPRGAGKMTQENAMPSTRMRCILRSWRTAQDFGCTWRDLCGRECIEMFHTFSQCWWISLARAIRHWVWVSKTTTFFLVLLRGIEDTIECTFARMTTACMNKLTHTWYKSRSKSPRKWVHSATNTKIGNLQTQNLHTTFPFSTPFPSKTAPFSTPEFPFLYTNFHSLHQKSHKF